MGYGEAHRGYAGDSSSEMDELAGGGNGDGLAGKINAG